MSLAVAVVRRMMAFDLDGAMLDAEPVVKQGSRALSRSESG